MIRIRVPATSANLGPGFDSIGVALNMYAHFTFEPWDSLIIQGPYPEYNNKDNLVYQSFIHAMNHLRQEVKPLKITVDSPIPVARGLGSSSACIVAGVMAANILAGHPLTRQELLRFCCDMEGHPDNVAPALLGGLVASMMEGPVPWSLPYAIHPSLKFCALIPDFPLATAEARAALPKTVPFQDAVHNLSRTAILLKALERGDLDLASRAIDDRLHQPYRWRLIPGSNEVRDWCREEGSSAYFISGAGSTLLVLTRDMDFAPRMQQRFDDSQMPWEAKMLEVDEQGALEE